MQKKSSVFKFLLPYIVILGVIIGLFIMVGNGSTQAINLEAQGFEKVVEVQKRDGYLVTDYKKKDDPSDDIYFKITFKSVEVEESSTVTGFSGKFELVKVENPVIDNDKEDSKSNKKASAVDFDELLFKNLTYSCFTIT